MEWLVQRGELISLLPGIYGDGDVRRQLYTDSGLAVFQFRRCILLNGIDVGALRGDLADRIVMINLDRIGESARLTERHLNAQWQSAYPSILGGLLSLAAEIIRVLPSARLASSPRGVRLLQPANLEAEIQQLGLFVGVDWSGRDAVSVTDAYALVTGSARRALEHEQAWRRHQDAVEAWEAAREDARRTAFDTAYNDALRGGVGNSAAQRPALEAASEAAERFEKSHRPPTFAGQESARSWFGRAADKIRESVVS